MKKSKLPFSQNQNPYRQQKREVEQIVRRIDKKRSMQIFLQRSEGLLIQNEIKRQFTKSSNQKFQSQRLDKKSKTVNFPDSRARLGVEKRKINTQGPHKLAQVMERSIKEANEDSEILVVQTPEQSKQGNDKFKNIRLGRNNFRPELQQLSRYISVNQKPIIQRRRKIIQMLVLCLMRRCHKKLYEALDIAIEISTYFDENDQETLLKSICLKLIGKIYKEIHQNLKKTRTSLGRKFSTKSSKYRKKRHSSFMIKTLASQRVFLNRFAHKFNKSKLLKQTNFQKEYDLQQDRLQPLLKRLPVSKDFTHQNTNHPQHNRSILLKLNDKSAVKLPPPEELFSHADIALNYSIILHQRSLESSNTLFPIEYPTQLMGKMPKTDYIMLLSAINSILFIQTQCYNFNQVLKKFITPLFFILLLILFKVIYFSMYFQFQQVIDWVIQICLIILIIICCNKFIFKLDDDMIPSDRYEKAKHQLEKWNRQCYSQNIIFKTIESCEVLIICVLNNQIEEESSNEETDSINQLSLQSSNINQSFNLKQHNSIYQIEVIQPILTWKQNFQLFRPQQNKMKNDGKLGVYPEEFNYDFQNQQEDLTRQYQQQFQSIESSLHHQKSNEGSNSKICSKSSGFQYLQSSEQSEWGEEKQRIVNNFKEINLLHYNFSSESEDEVIG